MRLRAPGCSASRCGSSAARLLHRAPALRENFDNEDSGHVGLGALGAQVAMHLHVLEILSGGDVAHTLMGFAHRRGLGIVIIC